jgi:hypothetical protein
MRSLAALHGLHCPAREAQPRGDELIGSCCPSHTPVGKTSTWGASDRPSRAHLHRSCPRLACRGTRAIAVEHRRRRNVHRHKDSTSRAIRESIPTTRTAPRRSAPATTRPRRRDGPRKRAADRHPTPTRAHRPRRHLDLPARHRQRRDHRRRPRPPRTDDARGRPHYASKRGTRSSLARRPSS